MSDLKQKLVIALVTRWCSEYRTAANMKFSNVETMAETAHRIASHIESACNELEANAILDGAAMELEP